MPGLCVPLTSWNLGWPHVRSSDEKRTHLTLHVRMTPMSTLAACALCKAKWAGLSTCSSNCVWRGCTRDGATHDGSACWLVMGASGLLITSTVESPSLFGSTVEAAAAAAAAATEAPAPPSSVVGFSRHR